MDYTKKLILYGMSMFRDNVIEMLSEKYGSFEKAKEHILFFSDSDKKYWGGVYRGINIKEPDEILKYPDAVICILSYKFDIIGESLRSKGIRNKMYMAPFLIYRTYYDLKFGKEYIEKHEMEIRKIYEHDDIYTVNLLEHIINERKSGEEEFREVESFRGLSEVNEYFYDDNLNDRGEKTWIDVGAYIGDTIESAFLHFKDSIKKYYAFEPSENNISELKRTVSRLNIENKTKILAYGLGEKEEILHFNENGALSNISFDSGDEKVHIKSFDELGLEIIGTPYIKMDIEGAEMAALKGMREFIIKKRPYLAICLYHRIEDILEVPSYIKSLDGNYKFYLRAGMHTECYAIPV